MIEFCGLLVAALFLAICEIMGLRKQRDQCQENRERERQLRDRLRWNLDHQLTTLSAVFVAEAEKMLQQIARHDDEIEARGREIVSLQTHVDCCNAEIFQLTEQRNEIHERYHELLTRSIQVRELFDDVS